MRAAMCRRVWLFVLGLMLAGGAAGQSFQFSTYIDTDSRPNSGCTVTLANGNVLQGVEQQLRVTVQGLPPLVTAVSRLSCSGGVMTPAQNFSAGYPVGLNNGVNGGDVVEFSVSRFALVPPDSRGIRLYFVGESDPLGGIDVMLTRDGSQNGGQIFFGFAVLLPGLTQWGLLLLSLGLAVAGFVVLRRHPNARTLVVLLVLGSGTLTAFAVGMKSADGQVDDWTGISALATDPAGDGSTPEAGNDLLAAFLQLDGNELLFRIDVLDLENQPPVANPQSLTTLEDTFIDVVLSATDPEGSALVFNVVTQPTQGTLGTITQLTPNTASVRYTPAADRNGNDSFTFTATDTGGASSAAATVGIAITAVNDAPQFSAQNPPAVLEDAGTQTAQIATGIAPGPATALDEVGQILGFNIIANDNAALFSAPPSISPAGQISYTPAPNANGTATLSLTLSDNGGVANGGVDTSAPQDIVITVTAVNDAPVNTVPGPQTILEDATLVFGTAGGNAISTSDVDAGANPVALGLSTPNGTLSLSTLGGLTGTGNGTATLSYTGTITAINTALEGLSFVPTADFNGATAVAISVDDQGHSGGPAQSATNAVVINITPVNDSPSFTGGPSQTVLEDAGAQNVAAWATAITDGDPEVQVLTFTFTANDNTALFSAGPSVDPLTGNLSYTPAPDAFGVANLSLVLSDDGGTDNGGVNATAPYTFSITVDPVNDAPTFTASNPPTVLEDAGAQSISGWATFNPGPANESTQTVVAYTVSAIGTPALFSAPPVVATNGTLTYTPAPDANGSSTFSVTVQDSGGVANGGVDVSAVQTFTITVTAVNDAPSFVGGPNQTVLEDAGPQSVTAWATAITDGDPEVTQPLSFVFTANDNPALFSSPPSVNASTGTLTYTSAPDAFGVANLTVVLDDGQSTNNLSAPHSFSITVTAVDDPPVAVADSATVIEDSGVNVINVLANDTDVDGGPISIASVTQPANGAVVITGGGSGVAYTPGPDYCNTDPVAPVATFTYTLTPGGSTATVSVTVTCVNDAPVNTLPAAQNIGAGGTLTFNAANGNLISIGDVDAGAGLLAITLSTGGAGNGVFTVNPATAGALATLSGNGTQTVTATGTLATLNAALDGATYTAPAIPPGSGNVTLNLSSNDQGNTGTGGPQTDSDNLLINIDNPPSVVTVSPLAGATSQGTLTPVSVTFSEAVAAAAGALTVSCLPSGQSASSTVNANTTSLSLTGAAIGAQPGDTCTVTVLATRITDIDTIDPPDQMLADFVSTYTIDTPPTVLSTLPANGASSVAAAATITVNFDENVDVAAGGFSLSCNAGPALTLSPATLSNASTVVLTPSPPLPLTATCTFTVNASFVTDSDAGDPPDAMVANHVISFTTVDLAPQVTTTVPANGGTVGAASNLTINFSEPVNFTVGSFTLQCPVATAIPFTVSGSGTGVATINPTGSLPVGTLCTVTVLAAQISDVDTIDPPDNMAANFVFSFTPVNAAPVLTAGATLNYTENAAPAIIDGTITVADADNTELTGATVQITANHASGEDVLSFVNTPNITAVFDAPSGTLTLSGNDTLAAYQAALRAVRYNNSSDDPSTAARTISWTGTDGIASSAPVTSTINITAVNDVPVVTAGGSANFIENGTPVIIDSTVTVTDPDNANLSGATISISAGFAPAQGEVLGFVDGGGITGNYVAATGVLTLTGSASVAAYQSALRSITYSNASENPTLSRTISWVVSDGIGASTPVTSSITITAINDAPVVVAGNTLTYTENDPATAIAPAFAVSDVDSTNLTGATAQITAGFATGQDVLGFTNQLGITGLYNPATGALTLTGTTTVANYQTALRSVTYFNSSDDPSALPRTLTWIVTDDGALPSAAATTTINVIPVNDPPTFTTNPVAYIAAGNTQLHVQGATRPGLVFTTDSQGLLAKAAPTDVDGPVAPAPVPAVGTSANGGNFQVFANGSFHYVPPAGFTGLDSFIVQVTDSQDSAALTVNVTVSEMVWYVRDLVDADNPAGGDGRSSNAFESLAAVEAASGVNHIIYIFEGNTAVTPLPGGITLKNGQRLWGRGINLTLPTHGVLTAGGTRPRITNAGGDGVTVAASTASGNRTGVEIRGLDISGGSNAIEVTSANASTLGVRISENVISSAGQEGIRVVHGSTGTASLAVHDTTMTATGNALDVNRLAGTGVATITRFDNLVVTGASAAGGIRVNGASTAAPVRFDAVAGGAFESVAGGISSIGQSGNGVGTFGVLLNNVTGDLAYTDLDIFADNGNALTVNGTGVVNVGAGTGMRISSAAGVSTLTSTGGLALALNNLTADLQLSSLSSVNSSGGGVEINAVGPGTTTSTITAGSASSINNPANAGFAVLGSNATVSYAGTITTPGAGTTVLATANTGGTLTFSGQLTGGNVLLTNNPAVNMSFSGGLALSTGTNAAFTATGGGTVSVTGTTNTLATTTATALTVTATTIGASDLIFRSITAGTAGSGPASGIVLNNTGTQGSLMVNGTGAAGTGGTIQRTSSHGISLTNTLEPSFRYMVIDQSGGHGVSGTEVNGFTFANGTISNSGTDAVAERANIGFSTTATGTERNLYGVVSIINNTLTNSRHHGIRIFNFSGTISNLEISGNTLTSTTSAATSLGSAINLIAFGSATTVANVTNATIANNIITNFPGGLGIQAQGGNANPAGPAGVMGTAGNAGSIINITGNRIAGQSAANPMNGDGILALVNGRGQGNFNISSNGTVANPISNVRGHGISHSAFGLATVTSTINNNVIVANNINGSPGIGFGTSQTYGVSDTPQMTTTVSGNNISATDGNGILGVARDANATLRARVLNNTVAAPLTGFRPGIRIDAGNSGAGENDTVCLNISGNTSAGSGGQPGIGVRKEGTNPTLHAFGVHGMAATATPGVESYISGLNPAGNGVLIISAAAGFSNCNLP